MASTIENMLVGIGFVLDKQTIKQVESAMDGIAHHATQMGKKVGGAVAGAFGTRELTTQWSGAMKELGVFSERFDIAASDVSAFDKVMQKAGASAGTFQNRISGINAMQNLSASDKAGMVAGVADKGIAGAMQGVLNAKDEIEGLKVAADAMQGMSSGQQERFAQAMGFSDAEVNLLRQGRGELEKQVAAQKQLLNVTPEMTKAGKDFDDAWMDLGSMFDEVFNHVAMGVNIELVKMMKAMSGVAQEASHLLSLGIDWAFENFGDAIMFAALAITIMGKAWAASQLSKMLGWMAGLGKGSAAIRIAAQAFGLLGMALKKLLPFVAVAGAAVAVYESATSKDGMVNKGFHKGMQFFGMEDKPAEDKQKVQNTKSESVTSNTTTVDINLKSDMLKAEVQEHNTNENEKAMDALRSGAKA